MKKNKKEIEFVKCKSCKIHYTTIECFATNQADDCASEVYFETNKIVCSYGSRFDTNVYEFVNGVVPDWVNASVICDNCIKKLLKSNSIVQIGTQW